MLDADDVIRVRVAAICWNDGRRHGKMGKIFFQLLHSDPFVKHKYKGRGLQIMHVEISNHGKLSHNGTSRGPGVHSAKRALHFRR